MLLYDLPTALVSVSEEVRSRCHVKHTVPRWPETINEASQDSASGTQNVRRQKSWDMLDQSAITFARQQQHKVQHQVIKNCFSRNSFPLTTFQFEFGFHLMIIV